MLPRHHLLWLSDAGWARLQQQTADERQRAVLLHWQRMRWPVVVRRADADAAADEVCVGIALPPDAKGNKPRIALRVRPEEIAGSRAPFLLRDIAAANLTGLPAAWQPGMTELQQHLGRAGIAMAVFGSLAWQAVTAQPYVRGSSDIDLLFVPQSRAQLREGVRLLAWQAMFLPLDGEIVFPDGAAVSWKEWRQVAVLGGDEQGRVLVKRAHAVALEAVGSLVGQLPEQQLQPCAA